MKLPGQRRFVAYTTRDIGLSTNTKKTEWIVYDKQEKKMVEEFGKLVGKGARKAQMENAERMNKLAGADVKEHATITGVKEEIAPMITKFQSLRLQVVKEEEFPYSCKATINSPADIRDILTKHMEMHLEAEEVLMMITVDTKHRVTGIFEVSRGSLNSSLAHPREVFKRALLMNAAGIFVAHNHPSGDVTPSRDDTAITERLQKAGDILGVSLLDHLIIGDTPERYYSFRDGGLI